MIIQVLSGHLVYSDSVVQYRYGLADLELLNTYLLGAKSGGSRSV